jgi:hypothetical protein
MDDFAARVDRGAPEILSRPDHDFDGAGFLIAHDRLPAAGARRHFA